MNEKELIESGNMKMDWARNHMPVLAIIREKFEEEKPLKGLKVGMALHVEAKTAVLVETLAAGGVWRRAGQSTQRLGELESDCAGGAGRVAGLGDWHR